MQDLTDLIVITIYCDNLYLTQFIKVEITLPRAVDSIQKYLDGVVIVALESVNKVAEGVTNS